jgi:cellulose synthase/poly-beta-1,6-N-acetylglucosamine synthase-like glycosyltransferase
VSALEWTQPLQWLILAYFIGINTGYIALNLLSAIPLSRQLGARTAWPLSRLYSGFEPPVSVLVPAYNEETTIVASVRSLLQLNYPEFEVIVVNDGSKDGTLAALIKEFDMVRFPEAYRIRVPVKPVKAVYRSLRQPNLRVIDKENGGGKADASNAAINCARYPLICIVDADGVLERDSLYSAAQPFLEDPLTIAAGGSVRLINGCSVSGGFLDRIGLPRNLLARFQIVEYLRGFLFGRLGWLPLNAVPIISGAFGVFRTERVIAAGGYRTDTLGEDMELTLRLHRLNRLAGRPYRIGFVADPVCWTDAPESLSVLKKQRIRWHRGLGESLLMNRALLFHPKGGAPGWITFPFMAVFEWLGPLLEVAGYVFMIAAFVLGMISAEAFIAFLVLAFGLGLLLSFSALLMEEISFHVYMKSSELALLVVVSILENFGYRQLISCWRLIGLAHWMTGRKATWGEMKRTASWQRVE